MINVITQRNSARLSYTLDLIFKDMLQLSYGISDREIDGALNIVYGQAADIPDSGFLWEENISPQPLIHALGDWQGEPTFFTMSDSKIPFDLFSAVFYLVSRYEEYLPYTPDDHHRFPPDASILVQNNWIQKPLINIWVSLFCDWLRERDSNISPSRPQFRYISTVDVDMAWKFRNKGIFRQLGGLLHDLVKFDFSQIREKWQVWTHTKADPFDNFNWQFEIHQQKNTEVRYFLQIGKNGKHDKNISAQNLEFRQLIRSLDLHGQVGIHPSYQSLGKPDVVKQEVLELSHILGRPIQTNRQHFLRMTLPDTYRLLLDLGIREDYTLGYTSYRGFRAGIAGSFHWFDLAANSKTDLILFPFCMMDVTPMHYERKSVTEAEVELEAWMRDLAAYGCTFISLWHNESLSDTGRWKGWLPLYLKMLDVSSSLSLRSNE